MKNLVIVAGLVVSIFLSFSSASAASIVVLEDSNGGHFQEGGTFLERGDEKCVHLIPIGERGTEMILPLGKEMARHGWYFTDHCSGERDANLVLNHSNQRINVLTVRGEEELFIHNLLKQEHTIKTISKIILEKFGR